jgi:aminoglycoside phosphotransferase (APT) family kinase protein
MTADQRELGPPMDAHRFDEASLVAYLGDSLPGFTGEIEVQQFLGGQSNPTFLISSGPDRYVLRKKPPGKILPSAHAVDREFRVMSALASSGFPVPEMALLCEDESVIGQMFIIMNYVPGRILTHGSLPGCSPAERTGMYHHMAEVFGALHSIDYRAAGLEDFGYPAGYVARQVKRWSSQYAASKQEDWAPMDRLIEWLPENDPGGEQASVVHGDFRAGNMIFDTHLPRVVAVLDWELSTIGHPLADLGYFLMPYYLDADSSVNGFRGMNLAEHGIPEKADLVETYASAAGRESLPDVDYYVVFAMFRLAAILSGVLKRGLQGNAADPKAIQRGGMFKPISEVAWNIADGMY